MWSTLSQGKVFAMTQQDAQATSDVVTSILSIFEQDAFVLIDPEATHSFISRHVVVLHSLVYNPYL